MKRPTRKKLIERLKGLIWISSGKPILAFQVEEVDSEGYYDLDSAITYYDLDDIAPKLMDLSLTHRIVNIRWQEYLDVHGMRVCFDVLESNDGTTNIDSEMMDLILRLNFKTLP